MKKRLLPVLTVLIAGAVLLVLFLRLRGIFTMALRTFVLSLLVAAFLMPLMRGFGKLGLKEKPAILCAILTLLLIFGVFLFVGLPRFLRDLTDLSGMELDITNAFPQLKEKVLAFLARFMPEERAGEMLAMLLDRGSQFINDGLPSLLKRLMDRLHGIWDVLPALLLSPVAAYYLLRDRRKLIRGFLHLFSIRHEVRVKRMVLELWAAVEGFFKGQLTVAFFVGLISIGAFYLLKIPFALLLGVLAGVLDLIPYFGPFIAAVPVLLVTLLTDPGRFVVVLLVLVLIQQAESVLISPRVLSSHTGLHPLLVMFATLSGGEAAGILGMILAVPAVSVILKLMGFAADAFMDAEKG